MSTKVIIESNGGTEVLQLCETKLEKLKKHEVLIEHKAIGVNYLDIQHRDGSVPVNLPSGIGIEGAGVILEVGSDVKNFSSGDRIAYALGELGSYASERIINADRLLKLPEWVSYDDAAAITLKGLTAHYLLHSTYEVKSGTVILMYGVAGALGQTMAIWAKQLGAVVIGVVSSEKSIPIAQQVGCDFILIWDKDKLPDQVSKITEGEMVDVVYDGIGKISFNTSLACLRTRGTLVSIGAISGLPDPIDIREINKKSLYLTRPSLVAYASDPDEYKARGEAVFEAVRKKVLKPSVWKTYLLSEVREAHEALQSGRSNGAILLKP